MCEPPAKKRGAHDDIALIDVLRTKIMRTNRTIQELMHPDPVEVAAATFARACIRRFITQLITANSRLLALPRWTDARHGLLGENATLAALLLGIARTCPPHIRIGVLDVVLLFSMVGPADCISDHDLGTATWDAYQQLPILPGYMWERDTSSLGL